MVGLLVSVDLLGVDEGLLVLDCGVLEFSSLSVFSLVSVLVSMVVFASLDSSVCESVVCVCDTSLDISELVSSLLQADKHISIHSASNNAAIFFVIFISSK